MADKIIELKTNIVKKLNNRRLLFKVLSSDAQKLIIAVSTANKQMVNKYCQNDSSKFILAMTSEANVAV